MKKPKLKPPPPPKKIRKNGSPEKLTPMLQADVCRVVKECGSLEDAAMFVGIHRSSIFKWQQRGREEKSGIYFDFLNAVESARAERRINFNRDLMKHGKRHWQALAWLAERTDPKHFGLRLKVQVQEELDNALELLRRRLPPDQYETVLQVLSVGTGGAETGADSGGAEDPSAESGDDLGSAPAESEAAPVP